MNFVLVAKGGDEKMSYITKIYIDDYLDKRASNCPLVSCKDCEYWNKETECCKHWIGRTEDAYYTVHTGADFYCEDGGKERINEKDLVIMDITFK